RPKMDACVTTPGDRREWGGSGRACGRSEVQVGFVLEQNRGGNQRCPPSRCIFVPRRTGERENFVFSPPPILLFDLARVAVTNRRGRGRNGIASLAPRFSSAS